MIKSMILMCTSFAFLCAGMTDSLGHSDSRFASVVNADQDAPGLKAGDRFPELVFKDVSGKDVRMSSLAGKYVYVDLWASWCYPCREEYPVMEALSNRLKKKNIAFVSISIDTRDFRWLGSVKNDKMKGFQWMVKDTELERLLAVKTIPRYLLLNKKGDIIDPNITRPSDPETEKTILKLKGI